MPFVQVGTNTTQLSEKCKFTTHRLGLVLYMSNNIEDSNRDSAFYLRGNFSSVNKKHRKLELKLVAVVASTGQSV